MPIEPTQLVIGRGEVYFDRFLPNSKIGTGERYFGNTTTFQITRSVKRLEKKTSYRNTLHQTQGVVVSEEIDLKFITDNISMDNMADWFSSDTKRKSNLGVGSVTESHRVIKGRYYQLGKSVVPFTGLRHINTITVTRNGIAVSSANNFEIDKRNGRIFVLNNAINIPNNSDLQISFTSREVETREIGSEPVEIHGALRFISRNAYGIDKNYFFPMLRLESKGALDLKGDDFQQVNFEANVLSLGPLSKLMYGEEILNAGRTPDEIYIEDSGMNIPQFQTGEDDLDVIINVTIPSRGY